MSLNLDAEIARNIARSSKSKLCPLTPEDQETVNETAAMEFVPWDVGTGEGKFIAERLSTEAVNANAAMIRLSLTLLGLNKQELIGRTRALRDSSSKDGKDEEPTALTDQLEQARNYLEGGIRLINTAILRLAIAEAVIIQEEHAS
jgi:hypothetical protein